MQKTVYFKQEDIEKKWYIVDATDETLGRLASRIAYILRGKHKPVFTPNVDTGDYVIVINAAKVRLTGKKYENKFYYWHTGYPGGIKRKSYGELLSENPEKAVYLAVRRMLPKNRLGRKMLKKLKVYAGPDHPHAAQKPEVIDIKKFK